MIRDKTYLLDQNTLLLGFLCKKKNFVGRYRPMCRYMPFTRNCLVNSAPTDCVQELGPSLLGPSQETDPTEKIVLGVKHQTVGQHA